MPWWLLAIPKNRQRTSTKGQWPSTPTSYSWSKDGCLQGTWWIGTNKWSFLKVTLPLWVSHVSGERGCGSFRIFASEPKATMQCVHLAWGTNYYWDSSHTIWTRGKHKKKCISSIFVRNTKIGQFTTASGRLQDPNRRPKWHWWSIRWINANSSTHEVGRSFVRKNWAQWFVLKRT